MYVPHVFCMPLYGLYIKIAGRVTPDDYDLLEPSAQIELNVLEFARWRRLLIEGGFSTDAAQLAKDHTNYVRLTYDTVRITFKDSNVLVKLVKSFPSSQKNKILSKLLGMTVPQH